MRNVELDSLLLDVFARARTLGAVKGQKVILAHEDIAATFGDRDQLQQLLLNLTENATKYTPPGGMVSLGLWTDDAWARIEVADNGPGIPAEDLPFVFERFFRSPEARQQERSGSGLGLAIARSIAEAHNGSIGVSSEPRCGATFTVWLPLLGAALPPAPAEEELGEEAGAGRRDT